MTTPRKHKHAALIRAWLDDDSVVIERKSGSGDWYAESTTLWHIDSEYRVKPKMIKCADGGAGMKTVNEILNLITTHQETCINFGAGHDCAALIYDQSKEIRIAIEELVAERDTLRDDLQIEKINTECYLDGARIIHGELRAKLKSLKVSHDSWLDTLAKTNEQSEANARLIATAPNLLEALKNLLEDTQHKEHKDCESGPCPVREAREAVRKATGGAV